jgi:hypothetical protein
MNIDGFLDDASRRRWVYGGGQDGWSGYDCLLFPSNWCHWLTGHDPAADLRGTYSSEGEADALLRKLGGYYPVIATRLASAGWKGVTEPQTGDIGLVTLPLGRGVAVERPAICRERNWIVAWERGMTPLRIDLHCRTMWRHT